MGRAPVKRLVDVGAAGFGLLVLWPVILILALLVYAEDGPPAFFRQVRVGRDEDLFTLWKLRTMSLGTREVPTHEASQSSVTAVGRFLRRSKLDELPQLWNVVKGDMSLVGPRPCLPSQTEVLEARRRQGVLSQLPGITGLAQVSGYDFSTPKETAACDARYAAEGGLMKDLSLIMQTVLRRSKDNADAHMRQ